MRQGLFLGVDQGTSSSKAVLISQDGAVLWEAIHPVALSVGASGSVTQDPAELAASVRSLLDQAISRYQGRIEAIGLSFQRSGVTAWRDSKVLHPMISHQDCSLQRSIDQLEPQHDKITRASGLPVLPGFAAPKIALLQRHYPDSTVGTLDAFVLHSLTGGKACHTEHTMAARTMLYDLALGGYSPELCAIFGVERDRLLPIQPSIDEHACYRGIPIRAMLGDQQSALLAAMIGGGNTILNLGTIASLAAATGSHIVRSRGVVSSILRSTRQSVEHLAEAILPGCGGLLIRMGKYTAGASLAELDEWCSGALQSFPAAHGFFVVESSGTPDWRALPSVYNGPKTPQAYVFAAVEHIAFSLSELIQCMKSAGIAIPLELPVRGGLAEISYLVSVAADASQCRLVVEGTRHGTAHGAAFMAAEGAGASIASSTNSALKRYEPQPSRVAERYQRWKELRAQVFRNEVREDEKFLI